MRNGKDKGENMSCTSKYILIEAENEDGAKMYAERFLDEYAGREFFDGGCINTETAGSVVPLSQVKDELEKDKREIFTVTLPEIEKEIADYKEHGVRMQEGWAHIRYGEILSECVCSDMPFFNPDYGDWTIPEDADRWYAVLVDLHY